MTLNDVDNNNNNGYEYLKEDKRNRFSYLDYTFTNLYRNFRLIIFFNQFFFSYFFFAHHHHHHLRTAWMNILHQEKKLGFLPSYKSIMLMFVYGCWEKTFLNSFTSHGNQFSFFSDDDGDTFTTTSKDFEIIINIDWSCFWNMRITK